jgi:hypothetical protein
VGGSGSDLATAVAAAPNGTALVAGTFTASATFATPAPVTLQTTGTPGSFLASCAPSNFQLYDVQPSGFTFVAAAAGTGTVTPAGVATLLDGTVAVAGTFTGRITLGQGASAVTLTARGTRDAFAARYSPAGQPLWAVQEGAPSLATAAAGVAVANVEAGTPAAQRVIVTGSFSGTTTFGAGAAQQTLTATGKTDAFVAVYDGAGALLSVLDQGDPSHAGHVAGLATAALDPFGRWVGIAGTFDASVSLATSPAQTALASSSPIGDLFFECQALGSTTLARSPARATAA